jgi:hypothetical protein
MQASTCALKLEWLPTSWLSRLCRVWSRQNGFSHLMLSKVLQMIAKFAFHEASRLPPGYLQARLLTSTVERSAEPAHKSSFELCLWADGHVLITAPPQNLRSTTSHSSTTPREAGSCSLRPRRGSEPEEREPTPNIQCTRCLVSSPCAPLAPLACGSEIASPRCLLTPGSRRCP